MAKSHVSTTVNGDPVEFLCDTAETMLDVLRNTMGLTGTKEGCGTGDCGACSIIVDGRLVCGCLMLAVEATGKQVTTIEGIGAPSSTSAVGATAPMPTRASAMVPSSLRVRLTPAPATAMSISVRGISRR